MHAKIDDRDEGEGLSGERRSHLLSYLNLFAVLLRTYNGLTVHSFVDVSIACLCCAQATRGALHPRTMRASASLRGSAAWHCRR